MGNNDTSNEYHNQHNNLISYIVLITIIVVFATILIVFSTNDSITITVVIRDKVYNDNDKYVLCTDIETYENLFVEPGTDEIYSNLCKGEIYNITIKPNKNSTLFSHYYIIESYELLDDNSSQYFETEYEIEEGVE